MLIRGTYCSCAASADGQHLNAFSKIPRMLFLLRLLFDMDRRKDAELLPSEKGTA